ncbi:MAG: FAD-binding oxidoreductase [Actinomycetota bacterium]|nr:FAD-binding oxidoreductase [Actinomycetota bacterium]
MATSDVTTSETPPPAWTADELRASLRGELICAGDGGYDEARKVYNGMIDRRPTAIVRCADVADVIAAVGLARHDGRVLSVRGGSHSVPGFGTNDDGIVCDLSRMTGIRVDPERRTARAEGGCTWGDLDHATHAFGLATTGGIISTTGVAGLTLGGGIGHLARGHGLSCDNLVSADVVTAEGQLVTASEDENADLLWALRGGGGNFGVVTSLEYRLHPVREIYGGPIFYPVDRAGELMRFYREFIAQAPEELGAFFAFQIAPPLPFIPEDRHGETMCLIVACWTGPVDEGERAVAPLLEAAPVVAQHVGPMPYPALNGAFDALLPPGLQHYWKADFVRELTDDAIAAHVEHGPRVPCVEATMHLYPIDGACHRVASDATAFAYRDARFACVIAGMWPDPADNERNTRWVREYWDAIHPHSELGGYVNFMAGDDQDRIRDNYRGNYRRLVEIKHRYDPENLFRMNQNIDPAG